MNLQKEKKTRSLIGCVIIRLYSTLVDGLHKDFDVTENNCSSTRSQEQPKESVGQFGGVLDSSTINPQDSFGVGYDYQLSRTAQFIVAFSLTE